MCHVYKTGASRNKIQELFHPAVHLLMPPIPEQTQQCKQHQFSLTVLITHHKHYRSPVPILKKITNRGTQNFLMGQHINIQKNYKFTKKLGYYTDDSVKMTTQYFHCLELVMVMRRGILVLKVTVLG